MFFFLHLLCLSNYMATGEVGHAVPSLLPLSNPAYFIIILSSLSAILSGRVWAVLGMPDLSTFYLALSEHTTELSGLPPLCLG